MSETKLTPAQKRAWNDHEKAFREHLRRCVVCDVGHLCVTGGELFASAIRDYHPAQNVMPLFDLTEVGDE